MQYLKKAVAISPNNYRVSGNLGSTYFTKGEYYDCIKWQIKSAKQNPESFIPALMAGWTYRLIFDLNKAEKWLNI